MTSKRACWLAVFFLIVLAIAYWWYRPAHSPPPQAVGLNTPVVPVPRHPASRQAHLPTPVARAISRATGVKAPMLNPIETRTDGELTYLSFRQHWQGLPIAPYGNVSITLGPKERILEVASEYLANLAVADTQSRPESEARAAAREVASRLGAQRLLGGYPIVWVSSPGANGEAAQGRKAYEYNAQGVVVIVDAATLAILKTRSERNH